MHSSAPAPAPKPPTPSRLRLTPPLALAILLSLVTLPLLFHASPHLRPLSAPPAPPPPRRPLLVYPKPRKTGSTFIASMLGTAVLRAGGRVAPCTVAGLMRPDAPFYGAVTGFDLLGCHTSLSSISLRALKSSHRDLVLLTSIREPSSWFASAAVWVREKKTGVVVDSEPLFREAVDDALDGGNEFRLFRRLFLSNYGLNESAGQADIEVAANVYAYVFDHATAEQDVNDALVELGFEPSKPSARREGVYDPAWFDGYRTEEVQNATRLESLIYNHFRKVREIRKAKPVPWAKLDGDESKVFYSALGDSVGRRTRI